MQLAKLTEDLEANDLLWIHCICQWLSSWLDITCEVNYLKLLLTTKSMIESCKMKTEQCNIIYWCHLLSIILKYYACEQNCAGYW